MTQQEKIRIDILGKRYGRLTVVSYSHNIKNKSKQGYKHYYNCKCDCGKEVEVERNSLKFGNTQSCGCIRTDMLMQWNIDNKGFTPSNIIKENPRLYRIYSGMKNRCYTKSHKRYDIYGGKGITICKEWLDSFEEFVNWSLSNGYEDNLTIDRIDVNGNYEPTNCRWVTMKIQANNKSTNKYIEYQGRTQTLTQWCEELDLPYDRIKARLNSCGMSVEEAFNKSYYKNDGSRDINKNNVYKDKGE